MISVALFIFLIKIKDEQNKNASEYKNKHVKCKGNLEIKHGDITCKTAISNVMRKAESRKNSTKHM